MVVTHWLRMLSARLTVARSGRSSVRKRRTAVRLTRSVEALEDRTLLSGSPVSALIHTDSYHPGLVSPPTPPEPPPPGGIVSPSSDTIHLSSLPVADIVTATSADWLELAGTITTQGQTDLYIFTVSQNTGLFIDIDAHDIGLSFIDSYVSLYDSGSNLLAFNDDGFDFEGFDAPTTSIQFVGDVFRDSSLYYDLTPGTYTIVVGTMTFDTGDYLLRLLGDTTYSATPPVLNSLSGAADTLYLDFDGHSSTDDRWVMQERFGLPYTADAFDFNGDGNVFSPAERLAIRNIWQVVSEDYSPFNLNVTTVDPGSFNDGQAFRMVMTETSGAMFGLPSNVLGVAYLFSYANFGPLDNVAFTFTGNFSDYFAGSSGRIMAAALEQGNTTSHEFGHALGLHHYATIPGANAPAAVVVNGIMASPDLGLNREIWGAAFSQGGTNQDDVEIIGGAPNTIGVRPDDHGNDIGTATALLPSGNIFSATGILESLTDLDLFQFEAGGDVTINVDVSGYAGNGNVKIRLLDSTGTLVVGAEHNPADSFSAFLVQTLASGVYYLEVTSNGDTGELGQYAVKIEATETPTLTMTVDPPGISEANGVATVTIRRNAGTVGDLVVNLTDISTVPGLILFPPTVTILDGEATATFIVTAIDDLFPDGTQIARILATAPLLADGTVDIVIYDDETAALTLTIDPGSISENGGFATGTLTRNSGVDAPLVVTLLSSDTSEISVPTTVTFAAGQSTVTFVVVAVDDALIDGTQLVHVSATAIGHAAAVASIYVLDDEAFSLHISPPSISENGGVATVTITRHLPMAGDTVISLTNSDPTRLSMPSVVVIPNGQNSVSFQVTAIDNHLAEGNRLISITASSPAIGTKTGTILIVEDDVPTVTLTIDRTQMSENGGYAVGTVTRNTAPFGNLVVQLTSSDTTEATVPEFVIIPDGQYSTTFYIRAVDDNIEDPIQHVTITATALGHASTSANIDVIDDDSYHVFGTKGNDVFFFYAGEPGQGHIIRVNGVLTRLDPSVRIVRFLGQGGQDELRAFGTLGNDNAYLMQNSLTFTGPDFIMSSHAVRINRVNAVQGNNQEARFSDGIGNDTFTVGPRHASLIGPAFQNYALGFTSNIGAATRGGYDTAIMWDSADGDSFSGQPQRSRLQGPGYHSLTQFFERVEVRGSTGFDQAFLYDSAGADTFESTPRMSTLSGRGFAYSVIGFDRVQASSSNGYDVATITSNGGNDQLVARSNMTSLTGPGYEISTFRFRDVTVNGGAGYDMAYLYDSPGNDHFTGLNGLATLQGTGYIVRINGFESVSIFGYFGINRRTVNSLGYELREFGTWT